MPAFTDYVPIQSFSIGTLGEIPFRGLIVVIGPNSSGKTQLLHDLHSRLIGKHRDLVVCKSIQLEKSSLDNLVSSLLDAGYIRERMEGTTKMIEALAPHLGVGPTGERTASIGNMKSWHSNATTDHESQGWRSIIRFVGPLLCTALFIPTRLTNANETDSFDPDTHAPASDMQALHIDDNAKDMLINSVLDVFGKRLHLSYHRMNKLDLRFFNSTKPLAIADITPAALSKQHKLDDEGDGLRSFVSIAMALSLGNRPVCLIDEPETCLHPPQAYAIGSFIGSNATTRHTTTVVTTHSSHVLRGIVEANSNLMLLRLTHLNDEFFANILDPAEVKQCVAKPMARREVVFDGLFADGVVLVESEGDRDVYSASWRTRKIARNLDALFVPVGGTGAITEPLRFYLRLQIPVVVIADLDLVMDAPKFSQIISALTEAGKASDIISMAHDLSIAIRVVPPVLGESAVHEQFETQSSADYSWGANDDETLMKALRRLSNEIDRTRRLKGGGAAAYADLPAIQGAIESLIAECKAHGLFLVPCGVLEYWMPKPMEGISKKRKQEWANIAVERMVADPPAANDVHAFVDEVRSYLDLKRRHIARNDAKA